DGAVAKIEVPASWAEPLRELTAEVEREAHADSTTPPDFAALSVRWARVSDAVRATVRARIAAACARRAGGDRHQDPRADAGGRARATGSSMRRRGMPPGR